MMDFEPKYPTSTGLATKLLEWEFAAHLSRKIGHRHLAMLKPADVGTAASAASSLLAAQGQLSFTTVRASAAIFSALSSRGWKTLSAFFQDLRQLADPNLASTSLALAGVPMDREHRRWVCGQPEEVTSS
jgi:hypothetical protein